MRGVEVCHTVTVDPAALGDGIAIELDSHEQSRLLLAASRQIEAFPGIGGQMQLQYIGEHIREHARPEDRVRVRDMLVSIAVAIDPELKVE